MQHSINSHIFYRTAYVAVCIILCPPHKKWVNGMWLTTRMIALPHQGIQVSPWPSKIMTNTISPKLGTSMWCMNHTEHLSVGRNLVQPWKWTIYLGHIVFCDWGNQGSPQHRRNSKHVLSCDNRCNNEAITKRLPCLKFPSKLHR